MDASTSASEGPQKPKRAAVACSRCRRYRTKCIASPPYTDPCQNCVKGKVSEQCYFPARGEVDHDRHHRRKQNKQNSSAEEGVVHNGYNHMRRPMVGARSSSPASGRSASAVTSDQQGPKTAVLGRDNQEDGLPQTVEIIEAIESFSRCYFQISFLPQSFLLENIKERPQSISPFLLLSILTVAAGWTPGLTKKHGGPLEAGDYFYHRAKGLIAAEMLKPSLQACQSFFLLSIYQWGRGNSEESSMLVGVSVRMLGLLGLHREGSYAVSPNSTAEEVTMSEVARRTFWAIITHEHLASGLNRLATLRLDEIDTLLPGDESDFSFGVLTEQRPSLHGTIPHRLHPASAVNCPRSLFASMVQSHALWANIAQWACHGTRDQPWQPQSDFRRLHEELESWYTSLPLRQKWSRQNLRGMLAEAKDIPFLSHITCYKLAGVVLRRKYLASMAASLEPDGTLDESILAPAGFWQEMAKVMVQRSFDLIQTIDDFFKLRASRLGFAPILIFALYIAGSISLYLQRWPTLCPEEAPNAAKYLDMAMETLSHLSNSWPMAESWHDSLRNSARNSDHSGWGALKAAAAAERSADESVGIFRHTNAATSGSTTSPSFSTLASHGPQSGASITSISPEAIHATSPTRAQVQSQPQHQPQSQSHSQAQHLHQPQLHLQSQLPSVLSNIPPVQAVTGQSAAFGQPFSVQTQALPSHQLQSGPTPFASNGYEDMSHAFINPSMPPLFPLTNEGLPYDAFEDDLVAFFRGEVPSYLDSYSFGSQ